MSMVFAQSEALVSVVAKVKQPDAVYMNPPTNSTWESLEFDPTIYNRPYKISLFNPQNGEDKRRLWSQTKSIFGYGMGVIGVLALMPEDLTGWDSTDEEEPFRDWGNNVGEIAVWDRDIWYLNFVGHPYFGGVYYQSARKSGYRQWDAFIYSLMMSTFYWEFGVEAFAEIPSIQDVVVTPVLGWVYGEWAFNKEQEIRRRGRVAGSRRMASTALFLLDPVDFIGSWVNKKLGRRLVRAGTGYITYGDVPMGDAPDAPKQKQLKLGVQYTLGQSDEPLYYKRYRAGTGDPVDTGIVGLSLGEGRISLDDDWNLEDGNFPVWTLGCTFHQVFRCG